MIEYKCPNCSTNLEVRNGIFLSCICGYNFNSPTNTLRPLEIAYPEFKTEKSFERVLKNG